jgi:hypothetical protein
LKGEFEMESNSRYKFSGFTFGSIDVRYFNLRIGVLNSDPVVGTSEPVGFAFELTNDERLALIEVLSSCGGEDN